jgi:hypothetical protein
MADVRVDLVEIKENRFWEVSLTAGSSSMPPPSRLAPARAGASVVVRLASRYQAGGSSGTAPASHAMRQITTDGRYSPGR